MRFPLAIFDVQARRTTAAQGQRLSIAKELAEFAARS
jgi:hypothetical protein